jgi:prepilin-type N-terminal cleavage/methylation domain-containing protein
VAASRGYTLAELLAVLAIAAMAVAVALPAAAMLREGGRAAAGARTMATILSAQRWKSVAGHQIRGLQFRKIGNDWSWREARDGNGNGLRTAEIARGIDPVLTADDALERQVEDVRLGFPPGGPFPEAPPGTDLLVAGDDPVRFGRSDLVSFSPVGSASSGTLYVTDGKSALYAVVLFGPTARLRVWRYRPVERRWTL